MHIILYTQRLCILQLLQHLISDENHQRVSLYPNHHFDSRDQHIVYTNKIH